MRPFLFTDRERIKEFDRFSDAAAIRSLKVPKIDTSGVTQSSQSHHALKIHRAVAPRFGSREFKRLAAIGFDLFSDTVLLG